MKRNIYKSLKITTQGKKKADVGFTLIELLLAASLMGIVITVSGWGLSAILLANARGEAESVVSNNLARAIDFISDDIKTANSASTTPPSNVWTDLGHASASAKLYLQIPIKNIESFPSVGISTFTINSHGLANGDPVILAGSGTLPAPFVKNSVYYVINTATNTFDLSTTVGGSAVVATSAGTGTIVANNLVIYYIRDNTGTWLDPKTVNRSNGPCSTATKCYALVDAIADDGFGFTATVTNSRQVNLSLKGRLNKNNNNKSTTTLSTQAFVRNTPP
ncbi:hypothetical protein Cri9333_1702 [Crinalium epipsammum PCC 9333]|uniref:Prepilin-type N-terminal cleavage/methylation domain-containing protein n=1 Tax=Crinalium epipsammum PCC 9333 TaxID=1173022 RepID=K9VYI1_9CYAN|nr:type II secretion system protein [Crinalium epipsammum]AFZ12589.1 hypothetical protein Cri9333_1702 [Crinalium epipsammum PCC 9333]